MKPRRHSLGIGIIFVLIFSLVPFVWMLLVSLATRPDFLTRDSIVLTLGNYRDILYRSTLHFTDYLRNSIIIAGIAAAVSATLCACAAYAVTKLKFIGKIPFVVAVLGLSMFPQICIVGYLFKIMNVSGLINTHLSLILPYIAWNIPLGLWIMMSYFAQIPPELDEAAQIDGAGRFTALTRITLPLALPGFLSTILLLFMFSFNEFLFALVLTTDHHARTIPVGIAMFQGLHGELPWGHIMAASIIASIPVITIAIIFQKRIIQGLTRGALKD